MYSTYIAALLKIRAIHKYIFTFIYSYFL